MDIKMSLQLQSIPIFIFLLLHRQYSAIAQQTESGEVKSSLETYIVHVDKPFDQVSSLSDDHLERWYSSFLPKSVESIAESRILHTYRHAISGFAAKLTHEDIKEMEKKDGFISARPQNMYSLQTTQSPSFLGLHMNYGYWQDSNYGEGVIIGLLDTGITPGHPSFRDEDMPPPPSKWKGKCAHGIVCNNKLIGARNFVNKFEPPIDLWGHGTHTSSTAAGNLMRNANVFGQAKGNASGIAPRAHVAMYKVCLDTCPESAILAGVDAAIDDGVDIISYSIGGGSKPFYNDTLTIGAFVAAQKGIFVSCAAGNDGPYNSTLSNEAPWVLTVGASTIDRELRATVVLGNKKEFDGQTVFQPKYFPRKRLPLVYPGANDDAAAYCGQGSLSKIDVTGKIVICYNAGNVEKIEKGQTVKDAGGAAMILINIEDEGYSTAADMHVLPASHVSFSDGQEILAYLSSKSKPKATIKFKGTILGVQDSPSVTHFSSRGPNLASPGILKPDIVGPGLSILAAWPFSEKNNTHEKATFRIDTGTSMACPHLSGIAALLKSSHPDWSPAAIKSAIMTAADSMNHNGLQIMDERKQPANVFALGAGHVYPTHANDPGLVYDIRSKDYIRYICGLGYTDKQVRMIVQQKVKCSTITSIPEAQLNYPSFAVKLHSGPKIYSRTVTNVGEANSTYGFAIENVPGVHIDVSPPQLVFTKVNQKITYHVSFRRKSNSHAVSTYVEGAIIWVSEHHDVRSPISVHLEQHK